MAARDNQFVWQKGAACNGAPSYIFFPEERKLPNFKENPEYAGKTYADFCHKCPVKRKCNEFADLHELHGTWGATQGEREERNPVEDREELREFKNNSGSFWPLYGRRQMNSDF